jgi:hypothetical protein
MEAEPVAVNQESVAKVALDPAPKISKKPRKSTNSQTTVGRRAQKNKVHQNEEEPFLRNEQQQKAVAKKSSHLTSAAKNNHHTKNIPKIYGNAFRTYIL